MSFKDFIVYILGNRGKTSVLELDDFFKNKFNCIGMRRLMRVTKQNFSHRRKYIMPEFFKDVSAAATKEIILQKFEVFKEYIKDYFFFLLMVQKQLSPNTPKTREEFDVDLNRLEKIKTPKSKNIM